MDTSKIFKYIFSKEIILICPNHCINAFKDMANENATSLVIVLQERKYSNEHKKNC